MWWIAACLGALLWLLVVRIKLKEKARETGLAARVVQNDAEARKAFVEQAFLPAATQYLEAVPEATAVLLLFGHFAWEGKPSEVHMEVIPARDLDGDWPGLAKTSLWVEADAAGGLTFEPPQAHWERLAPLEKWLDRLSCFASVTEEVRGSAATLRDYQLYASVRRTPERPLLEVVGEPS